MQNYLITGSNRGIGLELCRQIHRRGAKVIATCRKASKELRDLGVRVEENIEITGLEPVLGGQLAEKAVWVDEAKCIGCQYCVHVASNTFTVDEFHGRSRAIRQDGDSSDVIQEAIDTCPVDCIHWVKFEELDDLENSLDRDMFQTFGKPPRMNKH